MPLSIDIQGQQGLAKIAQNMATARVKDRLTQSLGEAAFLAEGMVKRAITDYRAVDTGFMRASVRINQFSSDRVEIGPNADYSIYVHEGTSFMKARPFIELATKIMDKDLDKIIERTGQKLATHIAK